MSLKEMLQKKLDCSICLEILKDPVCLKDCLHRFCSDCLDEHFKNGWRTCPLCRSNFVLKRNVKTDHLVKDIIDILDYHIQDNGESKNLAALSAINFDGPADSFCSLEDNAHTPIEPSYQNTETNCSELSHDVTNIEENNLFAVPADYFDESGTNKTYFLCRMVNDHPEPIDNTPFYLVLDENEKLVFKKIANM